MQTWPTTPIVPIAWSGGSRTTAVHVGWQPNASLPASSVRDPGFVLGELDRTGIDSQPLDDPAPQVDRGRRAVSVAGEHDAELLALDGQLAVVARPAEHPPDLEQPHRCVARRRVVTSRAEQPRQQTCAQG